MLGFVSATPAVAAGHEFVHENPLFGYTHLLASPYAIPGGRLVIGSEVAYGILDVIEIGTNVVSDAYKVFNAHLKLSILDYPDFAAALTLGYQNYNYNDISPFNPDLRVSSWQPGLVTAYELMPDVAAFLGGNLNISKYSLVTTGIDTSGYVHGADLESDLSWAYNPHAGKTGNVLSAGVTYDVTYGVYGIGVSHHWPGLHIGIHYYPNATDFRVLPILSGGTAIDF